jgi:hypothetical protein
MRHHRRHLKRRRLHDCRNRLPLGLVGLNDGRAGVGITGFALPLQGNLSRGRWGRLTGRKSNQDQNRDKVHRQKVRLGLPFRKGND